MQIFSGVGADMVWDFEQGTILIRRGDSVWNRANQLTTLSITMVNIRRVEMQLVSTLQMGYIRFAVCGHVPHSITGLDTTLVMFTDGTQLYPLINQLCAIYPDIQVITRTAGVDPRRTVTPPPQKTSTQSTYTPPPVPPSAAQQPPRTPASSNNIKRHKRDKKWMRDRAKGVWYPFLAAFLQFFAAAGLLEAPVFAGLLLLAITTLAVHGFRLGHRSRRYQQLEYARSGEQRVSFADLAERMKTTPEKVRRELLSLHAHGYFPGSRFDLGAGLWELPSSYIPTIPPLKNFQRLKKDATGFLVGGLILTFIGSAVLAMLTDPTMTTSLEDLIMTLSFGIATLPPGIAALGHSARLFGLQRHCNAYYGVLGNRKAVAVTELAQAADCHVTQVKKDLRKLFFRSYFPGSVLQHEAGYFLLPDGELPESARPAPMAPDTAPPPPTVEERVSEQIRQIRQINDRIPDPEMSRKIDRMEQITVQILVILEKHPGKRHEARRFLNYYLPTTLKLLNSYADFDQQEIKTESVGQSMHNIERMLDTLLEAYERQLDQLFTTETLDISAEIQVMEAMLRRDGLSDYETAILHPEKDV